MRKKTRKKLKRAGMTSLWILLIIILTFAECCIAFKLLCCFCPFLEKLCVKVFGGLGSDWTGNFGSLLAGIGALVSFYLLYKTLHLQRKQFRHEKFESRFFQLLDTDRKLLGNMHVDGELFEKPCGTARNQECNPDGKALTQNLPLFEAFWECILSMEDKVAKPLLGNLTDKEIKDIYTSSNHTSLWSGDTLKERSIIDISFQLAFWGTDETGMNIASKNLKKSYTDRIVNRIEEQLTNSSIARLPGFHRDTAPWFRMIYQTVRYANDQKKLNKKQKREYVKMLRAQISNTEAAVLFYDSLSASGLAWEFETRCGRLERKHKGEALATKYALFGNIPDDLIDHDRIRTFYPKMTFSNEQ